MDTKLGDILGASHCLSLGTTEPHGQRGLRHKEEDHGDIIQNAMAFND
jgi:hypothetical protein